MKISGYRLDEILAERRHIGPVCAAAQGLYAELCRQYNKFPDPSGFECENGFLMGAMGNCSINTLKKYREQLSAAGLIDYLSRQEEKKPGIYRLLDLGKPAVACSNYEYAKGATTSNSEHDKGPACSNSEHATPPTTSNFEHVEQETETPACSKFEQEHVQILNTTLNKSKLVSTNVLTLSLKKSGEEKTELEESAADTDFQMPAVPVAADPFETAAPAETPEVSPASPLVAAVPPKAKKPSAPRPVFRQPTIEEVAAHLALHNGANWPAEKCTDEAEKFWHNHNSKGWKLGHAETQMVSWQSCVITWIKNEKLYARTHNNSNPAGGQSGSAGNSKTRAAAAPRSRSATIASIQSRKRGTDSDSVQRTEFTDAEVVE